MSYLERVPVETLPTFLIAVDLGSFSAAARHLGIGQPAVSRQIARLEQSVGVELFRRTGYSVELTTAGRLLHDATREGFALVSRATDELMARPHEQVVIDVSTTFATLWLLDRLDDFVVTHPDVDVRVSTRHENLNAATHADVSIVFGSPGDVPQHAVMILPEQLVTITAAATTDDRHVPTSSLTSQQLARQRLLGLDLPLHRDDWSRVLPEPPAIDQWYSSYTVYLQAVVAGRGIGLGWKQLVQRHLDEGTIQLASDIEVSTTRGYFAYRPSRREPSQPAEQLIAWLEVTAAASSAAVVCR